MNWALQEASYRAPFSVSKRSIASCCRPKALTIECPVCISSTCPLSVPVRSHWAANCGCERRAMSIVTATDAGTISREMTASSGLIENIMISTPMTVKTAVISWVKLCWSVWPMLSMSFVTRLRMSPRDSRSK